MNLSALTRHWELKLLALAVSAGLWVFVMSSEKTNVTRPLPIELEAVPTGLKVTSERPSPKTPETISTGRRADSRCAC